MKISEIYYNVGTLLYCPANNKNIARNIIENRFGDNYSLALCLEDTINDDYVDEAEKILVNSLEEIYLALKNDLKFFLPDIFIRVRYPSQIEKITNMLNDSFQLIKGFIFPKFSLDNADNYIEETKKIILLHNRKIYIMPVLESPCILDLNSRYVLLYELKNKLDDIEDLVLNIRIGGNDLCNAFGIRRNEYQTIHDIKPINDIISDIITVFGRDYCLSAPVWEYFSGKNWTKGLKKEIEKDILSGFIGKTAIHPNQLDFINDSFKISRIDFDDACQILEDLKYKKALVSINSNGMRMNEYKTHINWAIKTYFMAKRYGIK